MKRKEKVVKNEPAINSTELIIYMNKLEKENGIQKELIY